MEPPSSSSNPDNPNSYGNRTFGSCATHSSSKMNNGQSLLSSGPNPDDLKNYGTRAFGNWTKQKRLFGSRVTKVEVPKKNQNKKVPWDKAGPKPDNRKSCKNRLFGSWVYQVQVPKVDKNQKDPWDKAKEKEKSN